MTVIVLTSLLVISSAAKGEGVDECPRTVIVRKGDTLWDISREYGKGIDVRRYIRKIKEINNLKDGIIYEGDVLILPEMS